MSRLRLFLVIVLALAVGVGTFLLFSSTLIGEDYLKQFVLQQLEQTYTMEAERRLHTSVLTPNYHEPVPSEADQAKKESESVTLF